MTTHDRDKVIAAAKEAGMFNSIPLSKLLPLELFYAIANEAGRVAEREECAKVCEELPSLWPTERVIADECSSAIRARTTK
jgi:hypothetical protein